MAGQGNRVDPALAAAIKQAISDHLQEHGRENWNLVRERWPDVIGSESGPAGERRFWRWVNAVAGGDETPGDVRADARRRARGATKKNLPAVPSPQAIMSMGAKAEEKMDMIEILHQTMRDVLLIRKGAVMDDGEGGEKIKNFVQFDSSIKRRLDTIDKYLDVFREIYDLQRMRAFYDEIVDIIAGEIQALDADVAARIMDRLKTLNDRETMTIHANVRGS